MVLLTEDSEPSSFRPTVHWYERLTLSSWAAFASAVASIVSALVAVSALSSYRHATVYAARKEACVKVVGTMSDAAINAWRADAALKRKRPREAYEEQLQHIEDHLDTLNRLGWELLLNNQSKVSDFNNDALLALIDWRDEATVKEPDRDKMRTRIETFEGKMRRVAYECTATLNYDVRGPLEPLIRRQIDERLGDAPYR